MKKNIHIIFVFGLLFFAVTGCSFLNKLKEQANTTTTNQPANTTGTPSSTPNNTQAITSTDGSCELSVPSGWSKQTDLNDEATLQVANPREEVYAIIIRENKSEFPRGTTIDKVVNLGQANLRKSLTSPEVSPTSSTTIGGFTARQFDASGVISGLKAKYLYAVVESPTSYYQIMTWTLLDRYDQNKPKLQGVIDSFKEVNSNPSSSTTKKP